MCKKEVCSIETLNFVIRQLEAIGIDTSKRGTMVSGARVIRTIRKKIMVPNGFDWSECEVESLARKAIAILWPTTAIEIVPKNADNTTIGKEYLHGPKLGSCMHGKPFPAWYDEIGCVELVRYQRGNVYGRALLWTTDNGEKLLDRIYPHSGEHIVELKAWALSQGYWVRKINGLSSTSVVFHQGDENTTKVKRFRVTTDRPTSGRYPYVDSFFSITELSAGKIQLSNSTIDRDFTAQETTGGTSEGGGLECYNCGADLDGDDQRTSEFDGHTYCDCCFWDDHESCEECYDIVRRVDCDYIESEHRHVCRSCIRDSYDRCWECRGLFPNDELNDVDGLNEHVCNDCFCETCDTCEYSDYSDADSMFCLVWGMKVHKTEGLEPLIKMLVKDHGVIRCRKTLLIPIDLLTCEIDPDNNVSQAKPGFASVPIKLDAIEWAID